MLVLGQGPLGILQCFRLPTLVGGRPLGPVHQGEQALQVPVHHDRLGLEALQTGRADGLIVVQGVEPALQLGDLALESQPLFLASQGLLLGFDLLFAQGMEPRLFVAEGALGQGSGLLRLGEIGFPLPQAFRGLPEDRLEGREGIPRLLQPLRQGPGAFQQAVSLLLGLVPAFHLEAPLLFRQLEALVQGEHGGGPPGLGLLLLVHGQAQRLDLRRLLGDLGREFGNPAFRLVQAVEDAQLGRFQFHGLPGQEDALGGPDLSVELLRLSGPGGLAAERIHLLVQLEEDVVEPLQVGLGLLQPLLGIGPAHLVACDARGLLQEDAAVLGFAAQDEVDLPLLDEAVGSGPHARVEQEVLDVLEPGLAPIDPVLTSGIPVEAARDRDFAGGARQGGIGHLQHQLHFGKPHGSTLGRAGENHIGHLGATEHGGTLFPQHPGQAVGNVGLAATIGPHHGRHPTRKAELLGIGEGLESVEFEGNETHAVSAPGQAGGNIPPHHSTPCVGSVPTLRMAPLGIGQKPGRLRTPVGQSGVFRAAFPSPRKRACGRRPVGRGAAAHQGGPP